MLVENAYPADSRVRNEAQTLTAEGIKVSIIALGGADEPFRENVKGVDVYRVPRLTVFKKLPGAKSRLRALVGKIQTVAGYFIEYGYFTSACFVLSLYVWATEGIDVVHAHNPPDMLFLVGGFHRLFGKAFVFDHHDLSPELYRSRYRQAAASGIVPAVLTILEKCSLKMANVVIATNESYREIEIQRHGVDPKRIFIVRNGPDLRRVRHVNPDPKLLATKKTILCYLGAMNPQDGLDYMLRALRVLLYDLKRSDFYCVAIGEGDSFEELKAMTQTLRLEDHVRFTGFVPDEEMMRYLSTADICLDPNPSSPLNDVSTWMKVMEYMALSKPVVSFDLKETRRSAAEAAVYVTPNDEPAFAAAIQALMDDPGRRARMGQIGRERIERELGWSITSRNLVSAYDRLLARNVASAGASLPA